MHEELTRALEMADQADAITMHYFHSSKLVVETKPDNSPVTQADREVEEALAKMAESYGQGYLGEEGARIEGKSAWWVVDPIDGTKNFMRGMPIWATLIAQVDAEGTRVAVVSAPSLGKRWWATRDGGAFMRDVDGSERQLSVSKVSRIEDAYLGYGSETAWEHYDNGSERVTKLLAQAWRSRGIGDFWMHVLVAEGAMDASFEPRVAVWDYMAPALIVKEAGGVVWLDQPDEAPATVIRRIVSSNGLLDAPVREALGLHG